MPRRLHPCRNEQCEPDVPGTTLPTGSSWYTTVNSNAPWNGTTAAMPYVWVRISWKLNNSLSYLTATGGVTTASTSYYAVNGASSSPVCWNGASEVVLASGSNCNQLASGGTADTPVFLGYCNGHHFQWCAANGLG